MCSTEQVPGFRTLMKTLQFNSVKEMLGFPDVAKAFQRAGISAFIIDPRTTGASEGEPRNDIDPLKQVEDLSDALTFLGNHDVVDSRRMGLWGYSFGAIVSLCAATMDRRAKFVIAVCPLVDFTYNPDKRPKVLARAIRDRESQVFGNPPSYMPMVNAEGENPVGFGTVDKERYAPLAAAGKEIFPGHVNRTTVQTYYKMFMWQPFALLEYLSPTPVMYVIPEHDTLSPSELQLEQFERLTCPKIKRIELGIGHEDVLMGSHLFSQMEAEVKFVRDRLG
jgi:pimeloyl-ACP methyl ester carboxylesterase